MKPLVLLSIAGALVAGLWALIWRSSTVALDAAPPSADWLPWLGLLFEVLGKVDWLNALLVIGGFCVLIMLIIWQSVPGDGMDARALFADPIVVDGRTKWAWRPGKTWQAGAFLVMTWAFFKLVEAKALTDTYVFLYGALWAGSPALNRWAASKFPTPDEPTSTTPTPVGTPTPQVNIEIKQGT